MAKKIPKTKFPTAATVSYERALVKMVEQMGNEALKLFDKHVAGELMQGDSVIYSKDSASDGLKKMLHSFKSKKSAIFEANKIDGIAKRFLNSVNNANRHNLEQQMRVKGIDLVATEPWLKDFMNDLINENVSYIKNIEDDAYNRIENIINEHVRRGSPAKTIREEIMKQTGISKSRAQFLAVDQAGSILGQMTAERHFNLGIERFTWDTSGDERVRDTHKALDGKVFSYDDPPTVNGRVVLPGEDYRCRCVALPVFDDDEEIEIYEPTVELEVEEVIQFTSNIKGDMTDEQQATLENILNKAPEEVKNLWKKAQDDLVTVSSKSKRSYYRRNEGVHFNFAEDSQNEMRNAKGKANFTTFFHEYGHHIDSFYGYDDTKVIKYKSTFTKKWVTQEMSIWSYKSKELGLSESIKSEIKETMKKYNARNIEELARTLREEAENNYPYGFDGVSDIISGLTGDKVNMGWHHSKKYWNDGKDTDVLGKEAFAHMFAAHTMQGESDAFMKKVLPKSYEKVINFIKEAGD